MSGDGSKDTGVDIGVDTRRPIDSVIGDAVQRIARGDRGFALDVAATMDADGTKRTVFEVRPQLPPVDEFQPPPPLRAHEIDDVSSLVMYATKYGGADRSLILYDDEGATLSIDEGVERGRRELVRMRFRYSRDWELVATLLRPEGFSHRDLFRILLANQHLLTDPEILDSMRRVSVRAAVKHDSDLRLDGEEAGVVFATQAGDELIKFPRRFTVAVPVLEVDVSEDAALEVRMDVRVEITLPSKPDSPLVFNLYAPEKPAAQRRRIDDALHVLRKGLDGWTVVRGRHREAERPTVRRG